jgi:H+/gluconate symporter-like permease
LKQVLVDSGISDYIVSSFKGTQISPLILARGVAAALRISLGSATVSALTAAVIVSPMVTQGLVSPELLVLATGAGSLTFSQVNDTGFWMFKEYFELTIWETFKSWPMMETIISLMGLLGCLILDIFIH